MEGHESELYSLLSNSVGSMRQSLQELVTALDLLSEHLDLENRDVAKQAATAMRSVFRLQRTSVYLDLFQLLERGVYPLNRQRHRLPDRLTDCLTQAADILGSCGLKLDSTVELQSVRGCLDLDLLELMILELLSNAASAASGGIRLSIRLDQPELLTVTVENQSRSPLPDQVFERYRAPGEAFTGSAGLGLRLVSLGAQAHGGRLILSEGPEQSVLAVLSIRLSAQPDAPDLRLIPSLIRDTSPTHLILSPVLSVKAFDLRDLQ